MLGLCATAVKAHRQLARDVQGLPRACPEMEDLRLTSIRDEDEVPWVFFDLGMPHSLDTECGEPSSSRRSSHAWLPDPPKR